ncbi:hypothetical protein ABK040_011696 [Willaertia magna]
MKRVVCKKFSFPPNSESLEVVNSDNNNFTLPPLKENHIRIKIKYGALNFADILSVGGLYQEKSNPPFIPGNEIAGIIIDINNVSDNKQINYKIGDEVILLAEKNGWQSYLDLPIDFKGIIKVPKGLDLKSASGLMVAYSTSHVALSHERHGNLKEGQTVLVLGASGGVGLAACQIAKAMNCKVIACASTDEKCKICKDYGQVDYTINYKKNENWFKEVLEYTKGKGCDVIYDPVGGNFTLQSLKCIKWGGRLLIIGFASSKEIPKIPTNLLLVKNVNVSGVYWGSYMKYEPNVIVESMKCLFKWCLLGKVKPFVSKVYKIEDIHQAMKDMLERKTIGRVLLGFDDENEERISKL